MIVDKIKKRNISQVKKRNSLDIPVGKWIKCEKCKEIIYKEELQDTLGICPVCGHHFRLHINKRLD